MISRYDVALDGNLLSEVNEAIYVHDINYTPAEIKDEFVYVAKRNGATLSNRRYDPCKVVVPFEIREYGIAERQSICQDVVRWAKNGGTLTAADRENQFLKCFCSNLPDINSVKNWTDSLNVEFTSRGIPFWQENDFATLTITGSSGNGTLYVPGSVDDAFVWVDVKANGNVSSIVLTVNGRKLTLSGISLVKNDVVSISYSDDGIQSIKKGSTSLLNKRSGVDDLLAKCGENNSVSVMATASVTATFKVRGMWL